MIVKKQRRKTHPFRICKSLKKSENRRMDMTNTLGALEKLELKVGPSGFLILLISLVGRLSLLNIIQNVFGLIFSTADALVVITV